MDNKRLFYLHMYLQIVLTCEQLSVEDVNDGDILVEGLYLQSAAWDSDSSQLVPSEAYMNKMPSVYIKAHNKEKWETAQAEQEEMHFYTCPVFMTMVRFIAPHIDNNNYVQLL